MSDLKVKYHSFRVEFQMRGRTVINYKVQYFNIFFKSILYSGAAHIHGVLFLDLKKIAENERKKGNMSFRWLRGALETIANDNIPNLVQKRSITEFVDKFISCSLQEPMTREIALLVQQHRHSRSCERPGTNFM